MEFSPTLQDFVLNLIYDPGARSAFELDPHGTLEAAGLSDITAADVQDVLPLVLDYAPLGTVPATAGLSQVDEVTTGVAHLDVAGAVAHLQSITTQVGSGAYSDLGVAAAGTMTADHLVSGVVNTGLSVTGGLDLSHDPAAGLDAVTHVPVAQHAAVAGTLDTTITTATDLTGSLGVDTGSLDVSGVHEATSSVTGSLGGLGGGVDGTLHGVDHAIGGLLPDGSVTGGVTGDLHGALHGGVDGGGLDSTIDHHLSTVTGLTDGLTHPAAPEPTEPDAGHGLLGLHF